MAERVDDVVAVAVAVAAVVVADAAVGESVGDSAARWSLLVGDDMVFMIFGSCCRCGKCDRARSSGVEVEGANKKVNCLSLSNVCIYR